MINIFLLEAEAALEEPDKNETTAYDCTMQHNKDEESPLGLKVFTANKTSNSFLYELRTAAKIRENMMMRMNQQYGRKFLLFDKTETRNPDKAAKSIWKTFEPQEENIDHNSEEFVNKMWKLVSNIDNLISSIETVVGGIVMSEEEKTQLRSTLPHKLKSLKMRNKISLTDDMIVERTKQKIETFFQQCDDECSESLFPDLFEEDTHEATKEPLLFQFKDGTRTSSFEYAAKKFWECVSYNDDSVSITNKMENIIGNFEKEEYEKANKKR